MTVSRRTFFHISSGMATTGVVSLTATSCEKTDNDSVASVASLAGKSLAELKEQYYTDLFGRFLPFMERFVIDHEYGGFMCSAYPDGSPVSTEKRAVFEGRGIWVYSFLYNNLAREEKYLETAKRSVDFLLRHKPRGADMWPSAFTREGEAIQPPPRSVNTDLHIAEGLFEFAKASGETSFFDLSRETLMKCLAVYDREDYGRDIGRAYLGKNAPDTPGVRLLDDWLLFLNIATQMLNEKSDTDLLMIVTHCIETITGNFMAKETGLLYEMLNYNFSRPANGLEQVMNAGNSLQAFWHLMDAAERVGNEELFGIAADGLKRLIEVAWDDVYGGLFNFCRHVDDNIWVVSKVHYAQTEALTGLMNVIAHRGDAWAADWFGKIMAYERETFHLEKRGYPLWMTATDRRGTFDFNKNTRIENYHQPRHLMLNLVALEGITGGSGIDVSA